MEYRWLDEQPYQPLLASMQQKAADIQQNNAEESIWCCQHPPTYTTGRRAIDNRIQATLPAPLIITDRGGETTFHGPGQLMFYPMIRLRKHHLQAKAFVRLLEAICIQLLAQQQVTAERRDDAPGVWSSKGKIAAIGLRIANGVTSHGMALNVHTDLAWFDAIKPCGLNVSMDRLCDHITPPPLEQLAQQWFDIFNNHLRKISGL